uniref:Iron-sulphur binding protein LdpA C-terminal domain-containing protein n=1 Tax=Aegilops tauschii subsp. strangulata TaxID=200361 RepID=A0A452Y2T0_AEGTS
MFNTLWNSLGESINNVKLVAVSLPNAGASTIDFMNAIYTIMQSNLEGYNLWQVCSKENKFLNSIFHIVRIFQITLFMNLFNNLGFPRLCFYSNW